MVRIAKGVGISMNIANTLYVIYYNLIIAYSLYYLAMSFNSELPWQKCSDSWGSASIAHLLIFLTLILSKNTNFHFQTVWTIILTTNLVSTNA